MIKWGNPYEETRRSEPRAIRQLHDLLPFLWSWSSLAPEWDLHNDAAIQLPSVPPAITLAEAIESTRIHRIAGLTGDRTALLTTRPFRAPYHIISDAGLIGGGHIPMPGEVLLAHKGVFFLDELP